MRAPGFKTLRRFGHWLRSRSAARVVVLGYHRVDDAVDDPFDLCTSPRRFREHLDVLREEASPLRMEQLIEGLRTGVLPRRAVLVTIDDGYADSLHHAKPALEERAIPGAVFVTTGLLDSVPWWESLAAAFPSGERLPPRLSIDVEGRSVGWNGAGAVADLRATRIRQVHRSLVDWPPPLRERAIERLQSELGSSASQARTPRGLTRDELRLLASGDGIEIGSHGIHHALLASLDEDAQRVEITESKRVLEEAIGRPLRAFSYPNGSNAPRTRELVRESGFSCAFGSHSGVATPGGDHYRLPRFWAGDTEPEALRRLVRYWG